MKREISETARTALNDLIQREPICVSFRGDEGEIEIETYRVKRTGVYRTAVMCRADAYYLIQDEEFTTVDSRSHQEAQNAHERVVGEVDAALLKALALDAPAPDQGARAR